MLCGSRCASAVPNKVCELPFLLLLLFEEVFIPSIALSRLSGLYEQPQLFYVALWCNVISTLVLLFVIDNTCTHTLIRIYLLIINFRSFYSINFLSPSCVDCTDERFPTRKNGFYLIEWGSRNHQPSILLQCFILGER